MAKTPLFLTSWNSLARSHVYQDTYLYIFTDIYTETHRFLTLFLASKFHKGRKSGGFITVSPH